MKLIDGHLDYSEPWSLPEIKLFTGNNVITGDQLVMGAGAALAVEEAYPETPAEFARIIRLEPGKRVVFTQVGPDQSIGWFQVKENWWDAADLKIIQEAVQELSEIANEPYKYTFHMNYPGIGYGKLSEAQVAPIVSELPDNVLLYR